MLSIITVSCSVGSGRRMRVTRVGNVSWLAAASMLIRFDVARDQARTSLATTGLLKPPATVLDDQLRGSPGIRGEDNRLITVSTLLGKAMEFQTARRNSRNRGLSNRALRRCRS